MQKVFITRKFPQSILNLVSEAGFSVDLWNSDDPVDYNYMVKQSSDAIGILCTLSDSINESFVKNSKSLRVISTLSAGFDHIDLEAARKHNVKIGYTPNVLTDATAELTVALLLLVTRRLIEGATAVKDGSWAAWRPFWLCGSGLKGHSVGIVGLGQIGKAVAERLVPFGVSRMVYCRSSKPQKSGEAEPLVVSGLRLEQLEFGELLEASDFVVVTCALTPKTTGLFDEAAFSRMRRGSVLVNVSRGAVIDQHALHSALVHGPLAAAGLDVCSPEPLPLGHELLALPNCVVLPHLGSATENTRMNMSRIAAENLINGLNGRDMISELKF